MVLVLAMFIRLCESLDRSHAGFVQHAEFARAEKTEVILDIIARTTASWRSGAWRLSSGRLKRCSQSVSMENAP